VDLIDYLEREARLAEENAWKALAGYKFWMFGYWAATWVKANKILGRPNPFRELVQIARQKIN